MQSTLGFILVLSAVALGAGNAFARPVVKPALLGESGALRVFDRATFSVALDKTYANPFDPAEIAVDAEFVSPAGTKVTVPAFWFEPTTGDATKPGWQIRFAPPSDGKWTLTVAATDKSGTTRSDVLPFTVAPGKSKGFVRRATGNNRYLRFDSGETYFPIGINLAWAQGEERAKWYEDWFAKLGKNGGNFARVWMCNGDVQIENTKTGLGKYDPANAAYFDRILGSGEKHGIGVMLCFMNHRDMLVRDMWGEAGWEPLPYNAENGGPATRPIDFFTHDDSRRLFKQRLRYIVARYSAYTSLMCWELFNEQEHSRVKVPDEWNAEMAAYLKQLDPVKHLVSTSASVPEAVWKDSNIDLTQNHIYGDGTWLDMVTPVAESTRSHERFSKPHFLAEMGLDFKGSDTKLDPDGKGTSFHNTLWAGALSGSMGTVAYWWWDSYVGPKDLWSSYKPIATFVSKVDFAERNFQPIAIAPPHRTNAKEETFSDVVLSPARGWARGNEQTIDILDNGQASQGTPGFLFGPDKVDLRTPVKFSVNYRSAGELKLNFNEVSDFAVLRVFIDDKPVTDFSFSALPNSPDLEKSEPRENDDGFKGTLNKVRTVAIPQGKHTVELRIIAGDWLSVKSYTFTNLKSSKFADLATLALQDESTGETLVWLYDATSNWKVDQTQPPRRLDDVAMTIPVKRSGAFTIEWFDTRAGKTVLKQRTVSQENKLSLAAPPFERDIAVRITAGNQLSARSTGESIETLRSVRGFISIFAPVNRDRHIRRIGYE